MVTLNTWQLILAGVIIFLFGWGTGRTMGESRAWAKMEKQEAQEVNASPELFHPIIQTYDNVVYKTEGSTVLSARVWQSTDERHEEYLMRTPNGRYFHQSHQRLGSDTQYDDIFPYTREDAMRIYNHSTDKRVSFEGAFDEPLVDA